ncbi:MAG TPA: glutaredoxin family protein [Dehalococcoidales bacterium]|nr:glutaredoxin family protein [Dehalococcoidales bacterium]
MAKEYLSQKKIPYQERDVSIDHDAAREMVEKTKQMGVPVIIVDDKEIIIGFNPARLQEKLGPELK